MAKKLVTALSTMSVLALGLTACSSAEETSEEAAVQVTTAESGTDASTDAGVSTENTDEWPDITYADAKTVDVTDEATWPAVLLGHPISSVQELQEVSDQHSELGGWLLNSAINYQNPAIPHAIKYETLEEYGSKICEKYPHDALVAFAEDPFSEAGAEAFDENEFDETFGEHFPYPYPLPDEQMAEMALSAHTAAIYAGCGEDMPNLEFKIDSGASAENA